MDILIAYDVNTTSKPGRTRLRKVAKACEGHGQRVQFSVFEASLNEAQMETFRARLLGIIDDAEDNLRIYRLHGGRGNVVENYGRDRYVDFKGALIA